MKINTRITGGDGSIQYLNRQGQQLGAEFQKVIIQKSRDLAKKLQLGISNSVDRGAVAFTNKAVIMTYKKKAGGVTCTILVKDQQAKYLYDVIVKAKNTSNFVPTSNARLSKQGNISGLRANIKSGRYKIIKAKNGTKRLIDTKAKAKAKAKKHGKRVIAKRELMKRKMIYDFYRNAEKGALLIFKDLKGTFTLRRDS